MNKINKEYLQSAMFGFNDALVSTTGVIVGISTGTNNKQVVILAGVVTILVEALSMGSGQYLSSKSAHPDTKALIQQAFKKYIEPAHSIASVAEEMRFMGITTRKGRPYAKSKVQKMLSNPFYVGINRHNGKDYPGAQEQLISKELFNKVQSKLHRGRPTVLKRHNPVFKNMIHCEGCGGVVTWQKQKAHYYGACQRSSELCRGRKLLREDRVEEMITDMLVNLVCPSPEIIDWVSNVMRKEHEDDINKREKLVASIQMQIDRIQRMDDSLYDDKLAGEITPERYREKHEQLMTQKDELTEQLAQIDTASGLRLEQRLVLLELTQKASVLYAKKSPEQKRLIITKLFKSLTYSDGFVSVKYTSFARAVAEKVQETYKIMEGKI